MIFESAVNKLSLNPMSLFLIDGFGALLSAFLLRFVLVKLEKVFGIPRSTLYFLAFLPCLFAAYDFFCYKRITKNVGSYLKRIAFANLTYCFVSIGLATYHFNRITSMGIGYLVLEILILICLVIVEFKTANRLKAVH